MGKFFMVFKLYLDCVDEVLEGVYICIGEMFIERIIQFINFVLSKFKIDLNYCDFFFLYILILYM